MATVLTSNSIKFFKAVFVRNIHMEPYFIYSFTSALLSSSLLDEFLHIIKYSYRASILIAA